ncbi:MAG: selenide, water dikinase SelD [Lachnospiraceae bacterium]|nr:selenide, water dikinase SelD [Lachnospiraceae bacterium]
MAETDIKLTKLARCAGCGAKVGAGVLAELLGDMKVHHDPALLVGYDKSDDASVYKLSDDLALVQTVDFFPPIHDDPYIFGQIAAANALSDVYAMGGEPKTALNIMAVPKDMPAETVHEILRGGYDKAYEAGAVISGGHSILDDEPKYGLAVTGFIHPDKILTNSGARPGDRLILTKPLGTGIITTAAKVNMAGEDLMDRAVGLMTILNRAARDIMVKYRVHACTDVTGFSLMGHGLEMAEGSDTELHIRVNDIDLIPEAVELARIGILPEGMYRNRSFAEAAVEPGDTILAEQDVLYDPQTSGGLLIAVDPDDAGKLYDELKAAVPSVQMIGTAEEYRGGKRIFLQ